MTRSISTTPGRNRAASSSAWRGSWQTFSCTSGSAARSPVTAAPMNGWSSTSRTPSMRGRLYLQPVMARAMAGSECDGVLVRVERLDVDVGNLLHRVDIFEGSFRLSVGDD